MLQPTTLAAAALALSTGRDVQYAAALAVAFAGDAAGNQVQVEKLANDLTTRFPQDTLVQFNYLPAIHAQLELNRANPSKAIEALQAASPYELGTTAVHFNFVGLYPVYVRGLAYLAARQGRAAEAEFQKIFNHRGVVGNAPIGALAHLGLARAYALESETAKARAAYEEFFTLWKDADPDFPVLKQAKAEHAKLQQRGAAAILGQKPTTPEAFMRKLNIAPFVTGRSVRIRERQEVGGRVGFEA